MSTRVTRSTVVGAVAAALALSAIAATSSAAPGRAGASPDGPHFYLTTAEVAQLRANVLKRRLPWVTTAWGHTREAADEFLGNEPQPADPRKNYEAGGTGDCGDGDDGWFDCLYHPGLIDGQRTLALAQAFAVTRQPRYAEKAREYLVAWSRSYYPPSTQVGHAVAEPVGIALKAFMAYDLVRERLTAAERAQFRAWARKLSEMGRERVESYMDSPWIPEAPYGNSATWSRALAVLGAAVVGGTYLQDTLRWNWSHRTPKGKDGSWLNLIEGALETRTGKMTEERVRQSLDYALYTWHPLALIADAARRVGYKTNLWTAKTASGKSLLVVSSYYEPYLTEKRASPYDESAARRGGLGFNEHGEYRAASELAYRNFPKSAVLRRIVNFGGATRRGSNYDGHITGFNGLTGGVLVPGARP
jgi:hypothetical protein